MTGQHGARSISSSGIPCVAGTHSSQSIWVERRSGSPGPARVRNTDELLTSLRLRPTWPCSVPSVFHVSAGRKLIKRHVDMVNSNLREKNRHHHRRHVRAWPAWEPSCDGRLQQPVVLIRRPQIRDVKACTPSWYLMRCLPCRRGLTHDLLAHTPYGAPGGTRSLP